MAFSHGLCFGRRQLKILIAPSLFEPAVMFTEPPPYLTLERYQLALSWDKQQNLLADLFELLQTPLKKLRRYGAHGPAIHEPQPRLGDLGRIQSP